MSLYRVFTPPAPKGGCLSGARPKQGGNRHKVEEGSVPPLVWLGGGKTPDFILILV